MHTATSPFDPASSAAPTIVRSRQPDLAPARRGQAEFDEITPILGEVLTEAQREMGR